MLNSEETELLLTAVGHAELYLRQVVGDGRVEQEEPMTDRLAAALDLYTLTGPVSVKVRTLGSAGRNSPERRFGPDLCVAVHIRVRDIDVKKGFLVQAKRSGRDGVWMRPAGDGRTTNDYGHWLWDGEVKLNPSASAEISKPSPELVAQCSNMLTITPSSFVWVYSAQGVAVVSASEVKAHEDRPPRTRDRLRVGAMSLPNFFLNVSQCFLGDRQIQAWDDASLQVLLDRTRARSGVLIALEDGDAGGDGVAGTGADGSDPDGADGPFPSSVGS